MNAIHSVAYRCSKHPTLDSGKNTAAVSPPGHRCTLVASETAVTPVREFKQFSGEILFNNAGRWSATSLRMPLHGNCDDTYPKPWTSQKHNDPNDSAGLAMPQPLTPHDLAESGVS
ncbi:hypothetical protein NDU88_003894 [Pleurodeles waltl]|uniref:Uncharacterized protein n=1 Tax=Pleurodeles waltl TaxID=8319 RepID=A0AAV7V200_PLEWA|nr:hypothetical protein NDU88_003894 [Pleurodeles waltl]